MGKRQATLDHWVWIKTNKPKPNHHNQLTLDNFIFKRSRKMRFDRTIRNQSTLDHWVFRRKTRPTYWTRAKAIQFLDNGQKDVIGGTIGNINVIDDESLKFSVGEFHYMQTDANTYNAVHKNTGVIVGELIMGDDGWLDNIQVLTRYQRLGIGSNLVRAAMLEHGRNFKFPARGIKDQNDYYLSGEGAALMASCLRKGLVTQDQCNKAVP